MLYFCTGFADALAQGMTAIITKMEIRLCDLKPLEDKQKKFFGDIEKQSIGNYIIFRMAVRAVTMFLGGFLSTSEKPVNIKIVYAILLIFPLMLIIWATFVFKEIPVGAFVLLLYRINSGQRG